MADVSFCPNLSSLTLQTDVYLASPKPWVDRDDLVLGGCRVGNPSQTLCYDDWSNAFINRVLKNRLANTVVLLSVGAGVQELRTLQLLQQMRGDENNISLVDDYNHNPITRVLLIDPGLDRDTGDQVSAQFEATLGETLHVEVVYFVGKTAYADATAHMRALDPLNIVAAIGALNVSFGTLGPDLESIRPHVEACLFVELVHDISNEDLHVVMAYYNPGRIPVVRDEPAQSFISRHLDLLKDY